MNCNRYEAVRDYALDELTALQRREFESHLRGCESCGRQLRELRLTAAALHTLPEKEIPQRIAFVSDKVFAPSGFERFFSGFWNSAARLGFASACILSLAILVAAWHRTVEVRTVQVAAGPAAGVNPSKQEVSRQAISREAISREAIAEEIETAVAKAIAEVRAEDARNQKAALAAVERRYEEKERALMISAEENYQVMQKHLASSMMLASSDANRDANRDRVVAQ